MKVSLVSIPVADPLTAHEIYTNKLGFVSREFDAEGQIAIVVGSDDPHGTAILLEPCVGTFAETYQQAAYSADLPIMVFQVEDAPSTLARMAQAGIRVRPDLDRPEYGLVNMFEDGCGNLLMLEEPAS